MPRLRRGVRRVRERVSTIAGIPHGCRVIASSRAVSVDGWTLVVDHQTFSVDVQRLGIDGQGFSIDNQTLVIDAKAFSIDLQTLVIDVKAFSIDLQTLVIDVKAFSIDLQTLVVDVQRRGAIPHRLGSALLGIKTLVLSLAADLHIFAGRRTQVFAPFVDSFQRALSLLDRRRGVRLAMCVRLASRPLRKKALHVSQFFHLA